MEIYRIVEKSENNKIIFILQNRFYNTSRMHSKKDRESTGFLGLGCRKCSVFCRCYLYCFWDWAPLQVFKSLKSAVKEKRRLELVQGIIHE